MPDHLKFVKIECPYCGRMTRTHVDPQESEPFVVLCDSEKAGCDRYFVASVEWAPTITAATIEGLN